MSNSKRPDLAEFRYFGKIFSIWPFLSVDVSFHKILNLLWQVFYLFLKDHSHEGCSGRLQCGKLIFFNFPHRSRLAQPYASNAGRVKEPSQKIIF